MKFTFDGQIEIRVSYYPLKNHMLQVQVIDTGEGVAAEDIESLFTRFGKLQRTAEVNDEGIGLGLTIVKQLVKSAQGHVSVESDGIGKGATFTFTMKMEPVIDGDKSFGHLSSKLLRQK